jgi:hypothetical protein
MVRDFGKVASHIQPITPVQKTPIQPVPLASGETYASVMKAYLAAKRKHAKLVQTRQAKESALHVEYVKKCEELRKKENVAAELVKRLGGKVMSSLL